MDNGEDEDNDDDDGIMNFNDDYCDVLFVNLYWNGILVEIILEFIGWFCKFLDNILDDDIW